MWNCGVPTLKIAEKESIKRKGNIKVHVYQVSESFGISGANSGVTQVSKLASDLTRSIGGSCCFTACPPAEQDPLMH